MNVRRCFALLAACVLAVGSVSAAKRAHAQILTVAIKSADDLLTQVRTLAGTFDAGTAKPILDGLDVLEAGEVLKGVDRAKPLLATFEMFPAPQSGPLGLPRLVLYVPVTNQADFLATIRKFGVDISDQANAEGFSHRLNLVAARSAPPFFVLASPPTGFTVITNVPSGVDALRASKPEQLRPANSGAVFAGLRIDRIPQPYHEPLIGAVKRLMAGAKVQRGGQSDAEFKGQVASATSIENAVASLVHDGRELSFNLDINPKSNRFSIGLKVDAKPDSALAGSFASFAARKSRFRALSHGAAVSLAGIIPLDDGLRALVRDIYAHERARPKKEDEADDARMTSLLMDALEPTLTGDSIDACVVMDAPPAATNGDRKMGSNTIVFGAAVKESKKVEAVVLDAMTNAAKSKKLADLTLDFARGDDGTKIHRAKLNGDPLKESGFGEPYLYLAFPEDAALTAMGNDGLASMKHALKAIQTPADPAKSAPQVALGFEAGRFAGFQFTDGTATEKYQAAANAALAGPNKGKDHMTMALKGEPNSVRLSLDADLPLLRFFQIVGAQQK